MRPVQAEFIKPYVADGGDRSDARRRARRQVNAIRSDARPIWIVEGELRAHSAAGRLDPTVLSIPEVECWRIVLPDLIDLRPEGGRVVIALDADRLADPLAHMATWDLAQACLALSFRVEVAAWDDLPGGADGVREAGPSPRMLPSSVLAVPDWHHKLKSRVLATVRPRDIPRPLGLKEMMDRMEEELRAAFR